MDEPEIYLRPPSLNPWTTPPPFPNEVNSFAFDNQIFPKPNHILDHLSLGAKENVFQHLRFGCPSGSPSLALLRSSIRLDHSPVWLSN